MPRRKAVPNRTVFRYWELLDRVSHRNHVVARFESFTAATRAQEAYARRGMDYVVEAGELQLDKPMTPAQLKNPPALFRVLLDEQGTAVEAAMLTANLFDVRRLVGGKTRYVSSPTFETVQLAGRFVTAPVYYVIATSRTLAEQFATERFQKDRKVPAFVAARNKVAKDTRKYIRFIP